MTGEEQERYLEYVHSDEHFSWYYDEIIVLLGTGIRISEFMGITFSDLDFEERKIRVDHQLTRTRNGKYYVEKTKTENGVRFIYMTDKVKEALLNIIANRQKPRKEMVVDGRAWNESQNPAISHGTCGHNGDIKCVPPCILHQSSR